MEDIDKIIERYKKLHKETTSMLTDYFNVWLGFDCIAYGDEWQKDYFLTNIDIRVNVEGKAYDTHWTHNKIKRKIENSLKNYDGKFAQYDLEHLSELEKLVEYTNKMAKEKNLTKPVVHEIYSHLIPFLYGRKTKRTLKGESN